MTSSLLGDMGVGMGIEAGSTAVEQAGIFLGGAGIAAGVSAAAGAFGNEQLATKTGIVSRGLLHGFKAGHGSVKGVLTNYGLQVGSAAVGGIGIHMLRSNEPHNKINSNEATTGQSNIVKGAIGGAIVAGSFVGAPAAAIMSHGPSVFKGFAESQGLQDYMSARRSKIESSTKINPEKKQAAIDQLDRYETYRKAASESEQGALAVAGHARNEVLGDTKIGNKIFKTTDKMAGKLYNMKGRGAAIVGGSLLAGAIAGAAYKAANE